MNLAALIDRHVRRRPDAPAILAPGRGALSFGQLGDRLEIVGTTLRRFGVEPSDRVAIVLPNGPEMAVAALATASVATCAPLSPGLRNEESLQRLSDLKPRFLIMHAAANGAARATAAALGIRCLDIEWDDATPAGTFEFGELASAKLPRHETPDDDDIALVLYTTGTTARPKLVPLTQDNLCRSAANVASALRLGPDDRCLNLMPLYHIHGFVAALLASLGAGASVACAPGYVEGRFAAWMSALRPTWYTAVPTVHDAILAEVSRNPSGRDIGRLRFVRSASAPLPARVARDLEAVFGAPVIEAYGMTEAAHQIASNPLPPGTRKPGSVGVPAGPEVAALTESGQVVDRNASGEIVVRGANVTRGYVADDAANASAFVDGWFRTGDLGRIDADGYVWLTGRLKELINRGGAKVSPREVDDALGEHPAVLRGMAFGVAHPTLGEDVAAAAILKPGMEATEEDIRRFLIDRLAWVKVPSRVLIVDDIPLGDTGKVRRADLAATFADRLKSTGVEPNGELEALVAALFAEVLAIDRVGATDNFFMLGGDSLRAGQVIARLSAQKGVYLPPIALFRSPTAAEFAREVANAPVGVRERTSFEHVNRVERSTDGRAAKSTTRAPSGNTR